MSSSTVPPPFVPVHDSEEFLATELLPLTSATLTIRIIKSFPFRTTKNLVLKDVDLTTMTVGQLMDKCREGECSRCAGGCVVRVRYCAPHHTRSSSAPFFPFVNKTSPRLVLTLSFSRALPGRVQALPPGPARWVALLYHCTPLTHSVPRHAEEVHCCARPQDAKPHHQPGPRRVDPLGHGADARRRWVW